MNDKDLEAICKRIEKLEDKINREKKRNKFIDSEADEIFHKLIDYLINSCYLNLAGNRILDVKSIIYNGFNKVK